MELDEVDMVCKMTQEIVDQVATGTIAFDGLLSTLKDPDNLNPVEHTEVLATMVALLVFNMAGMVCQDPNCRENHGGAMYCGKANV